VLQRKCVENVESELKVASWKGREVELQRECPGCAKINQSVSKVKQNKNKENKIK
jgi:hypothetical protein